MSYKLFLIDLDGTMYRGTEKIEEAPIFIEQLRKSGQDFLFLTNNSTKRPEDVAHHLASFGIEVGPETVYTTSMATADFIHNRQANAKVYMTGEVGLKSALEEVGCQIVTTEEEAKEADFVVIGLDREITYEKLALASLAVRGGATYICTNGDKALPTERGLLPGNGSIASVITTSTGVQPIFIGKPEALMINLILEEKGLQKEDLLMIGDNYDTDIMSGFNAGIDTAIVFTGFTSEEELKSKEHQPTYQWKNLLEWESITSKI